MQKKTRDAQATKAKIINTSMILFSTNGYDATTADEIAKACGVNKAMIFYYYKNKVGLYGAVLSHALESIHDEVISKDKEYLHPLEDLKTFIKTYALYCEKHPYLPALLLRELSNSGAYLPDVMFESMRKLFALLSKILKEGEKQKLFSNVEPMIIHFMIVGTINLFITTKPLRKKSVKLEDGLNTCCECDMEYVADYIFNKVKLMLGV